MLQYDGFYYARHQKIDGGEVKAHTSQRPTRQELISGFRTMKQAYEYCYSPPGRDASPSQGYPPEVCRRYPFIHLGEERQIGVKLLV